MSRFSNLDARIDGALKAGESGPEIEAADDQPVPENPGEPEGDPEPEAEPEKEAIMADDTPLAERDDYKAGVAAGQTAANDRMKAVFASEHFAGREARACTYLATGMSAAEITGLLATDPKAETVDPAAALAAAEEGGRKEMAAQMQGRGNADLGGDGGNAQPSRAQRILNAQRKATGRAAPKE